MAGCVMNYHNTLAERASNHDWMVRYCQDIVYDYVYGNNDVTLAEAKQAEWGKKIRKYFRAALKAGRENTYVFSKNFLLKKIKVGEENT
nr:MAG TPA: hypothetical protein [Caudoviricetes sp.]